MSEKSYYAVFETAAGWVAVLGSPAGLRRATLPQRSEAIASLLVDGTKGAASAPELFKDLTDRFRSYFSGSKVEFPDKLDLAGATPFQQAVWRSVRLIPYGQTRSYKWVAGQVGSPGAARAVGQALAVNPLPVIVPCHRVLASDGGLGGFSGGLDMKKYLLDSEAKACAVCLPGTINSRWVF
jgi:methylated-DNA-[protein]-cysteine S-methyltransferase